MQNGRLTSRPFCMRNCRSGSRVGVDDAFSQCCQLVVGIAFFIKRLLNQVEIPSAAEYTSVGAHVTVACNPIVLHSLGGGDEPGIQHIRIASFLDRVVPLLDQAFHSLALVTTGAEVLKDTLS